MNLIALALKACVPARIKRRKLNALFEATAEAFEVPVPELDHLSFGQSLELYATFTKEQVETRLHAGKEMGNIAEALYRHAYSLGSELREQLHLKSRRDLLSAGRTLYRAIGIDFEGNSTGSVVIRSCYFSQFYSAEICRIMSSLDEGIAAGLSAGGKLTFSRRITDGNPCCEAFLDFEGHAG